MNLRGIISISIQVLLTIVVILYFRNHRHRRSIILGVITILIIFTLGDALPYIVIQEREFQYIEKIHHSTIGLGGFVGIGLYKLLLYFRNSKAQKIQHFIEHQQYTRIGFTIKVSTIVHFCIGIGLVSVLSQLHEIIYFWKLDFPDRGFPWDIHLWNFYSREG